MQGFVYVLGNRSMPRLLKIGRTKTCPLIRMGQLSAPTSVPEKFDLLAFFMCPDVNRAERQVHGYLSDCRLNDRREFFRSDLAIVAGGLEAYEGFVTTEGSYLFAEEMIHWIEMGQPPLWDQLVFSGLLRLADWRMAEERVQVITGVNLDEYLCRAMDDEPAEAANA